MFTKLNQYLLTHHPLLWNSRVLPFLLLNIIFHLLFFLGGFLALDIHTLREYYGLSGVIDGGLVAFSVLLSLVVIITWLIFFLRNNAFKQFYILGPFHLIKEFLLIMLLLFSSVTFYESFLNGTIVKAKSITNRAELVREANTINLARAFIPRDKGEYFIDNTCGNGNAVYQATVDYSDSVNVDQRDSGTIKVRKALERPDAFSYRHYCNILVNLQGTPGFDTGLQIKAKVNRWLNGQRKDSIRAVLNECLAICKKYDIKQNINVNELSELPFANPANAVSKLYQDGSEDYMPLSNSPYYFNSYGLTRTLSFIDDCYSPARHYRAEMWLMELYLTLGFSILLLCYRRFSKKVFLISFVGGIVWFLFFAIVGVASRNVIAPGVLFVILFMLFTLMGMLLTGGNRNKTMAGVMLCWHLIMLPALLPIICGIITTRDYDNYSYQFINYDSWCANHPVYCWVEHNFTLIAWINLGVSFLYTLFVFNPLTKRWHIMAEE